MEHFNTSPSMELCEKLMTDKETLGHVIGLDYIETVNNLTTLISRNQADYDENIEKVNKLKSTLLEKISQMDPTTHKSFYSSLNDIQSTIKELDRVSFDISVNEKYFNEFSEDLKLVYKNGITAMLTGKTFKQICVERELDQYRKCLVETQEKIQALSKKELKEEQYKEFCGLHNLIFYLKDRIALSSDL